MVQRHICTCELKRSSDSVLIFLARQMVFCCDSVGGPSFLVKVAAMTRRYDVRDRKSVVVYLIEGGLRVAVTRIVLTL